MGSAPDPAVGAYSAPQTPSCIYGGEREGEEKGKGKGRAGREENGRWGWEGKEGEGREQRRMGACTHLDFRKSAPMYAFPVQVLLPQQFWVPSNLE